jgi:hypothetical protein
VALWHDALTDEEIVDLSGGPAAEQARGWQLPNGSPTGTMQYSRAPGGGFVGDCLPFFHDGVFHFYYLRDRHHHKSKAGLGAHQWAHSSSPDLVGWTHHPLAIPITEQREGSICTGSVFCNEGTWYGFYATRMPDRTEHLSPALSTDGIHFTTAALYGVEGLDRPFQVELLALGDILDVCIDGRRTLINHDLTGQGDALFFFCHDGAVGFEEIEIRPVMPSP